jgi:DNA-binding PadR family transcriptional regulator
MTARLSTTSYAVLGMYALRAWTPYELAQQMRRSLAYCWPISERAVYNEPERLLASGHLDRADPDGAPQARRRYEITPRGRDALRQWLETSPAAPRFFNESMLRLLFADQGGTSELLQALDTLEQQVRAWHRQGQQQMTGYLDGTAPFLHRAHLNALFADLVDRMFSAIEEWAADARREVETWPSTADRGLTDHARQILERVVGGTGEPAEAIIRRPASTGNAAKAPRARPRR